MVVNEKNLKNAEWIKKCEDSFFDRFNSIAEDIAKKRALRIVRLFGPTCSGKTTAADILISLFGKLGKRAHVISIDDFFYPRGELLRRSREKGIDGIDYDSPDTIDLELLRAFTDEIFNASVVHCPVFDFKVGECVGYRELSIDDDDIFIFEGIQANYPNVISILSSHGSASIYIAPQSAVCAGGETFEPNELRLMRRLVRDYHFRGSKPEFTLMLWESVRENEEKNIFPYINSDYAVDSAMEYEIGVLKPYLCDIVAGMDKNDERYPTAAALIRKISQVDEIPSELILDGMLYCEFV